MAYGEPRCPRCGMNWPLHVLPCTPWNTNAPQTSGFLWHTFIDQLLKLHWKNGATVLTSEDRENGEVQEFTLEDEHGNILVSTGETWEFCNECGPSHRQSWPCPTVKLLWEYGYELQD